MAEPPVVPPATPPRPALDDAAAAEGVAAEGVAEEVAEEVAVVRRRRSRIAPVVAAAVAVAFAGFLVVLATSEPSGSRQARSPLLDKPAPAVVGDTIAGQPFDLTDLRGRWTLVNFFGTWCPPCIAEHPELVEWQRRNDITGEAQVISIAFGETDGVEPVRAFFDERGGDWPVLMDDSGALAASYGVVKLPESYLVDPVGIVRAKLIGGVTADGLDELLGRLTGRIP
jgi:cytochrome c biogenesis protein CcmG/thiol:disulfide interchange protein DsbE